MFWGCPALRAGRAVRGLAGLLGPALFRYAQKLGLAFGHPLPSLSQAASPPLVAKWANKDSVKSLIKDFFITARRYKSAI